MKGLLQFLNASPSRFHAVENLKNLLEAEGYQNLSEGQAWDLTAGGKYLVVRGGSALIAFRLPDRPVRGLMISASHSDSPAFRVKENAELAGPEKYLRLNTEKYGGAMFAPWLDRPLTVAGRVLVKDGNAIQTKLVYVDKDLLMIPNVAKHMNRAINDGFKYDPKCDLVPLISQSAEQGTFLSIVARSADCAAEDILGTDLYLQPRQRAIVWGAEDEFISSSQLDDLQCAWGCFQGFLAAGESGSIPLYALLDNEEIGSQTKQGAGGTFLEDVAARVCAAVGIDRAAAVANSFMVSADNAHAVHPNHPEFHDATHRPLMNGGVVIKRGVRYTTDGIAQAVFAALCEKATVPVQYFTNRSDMPGGGTLARHPIAHVSANSVDVGLAQLAMHSCLETAGVKDTDYLIRAMAAFYGASFQEENGRFVLE